MSDRVIAMTHQALPRIFEAIALPVPVPSSEERGTKRRCSMEATPPTSPTGSTPPAASTTPPFVYCCPQHNELRLLQLELGRTERRLQHLKNEIARAEGSINPACTEKHERLLQHMMVSSKGARLDMRVAPRGARSTMANKQPQMCS